MKDINILINNGVSVKESLEIFGDIELYNETIIDFLNSINKKMQDLKKFKEVGDMNNYAILVHSLKSDAKYLGFTKLAELAYAHELQSKANNYNFVLENFMELVNETYRMIKVATLYTNGDTKKTEEVGTNSDLKKILVVDDSEIIRNIIKKIFNNEFEVLSANDGNEAIKVVSDNSNLIGLLLDLNMPHVDGFAVLDFFKKNNLFDKIPVAIITGDDSKETTDKSFEYPIIDVLNKPFNESNVKRVVNTMLNFK